MYEHAFLQRARGDGASAPQGRTSMQRTLTVEELYRLRDLEGASPLDGVWYLSLIHI